MFLISRKKRQVKFNIRKKKHGFLNILYHERADKAYIDTVVNRALPSLHEGRRAI